MGSWERGKVEEIHGVLVTKDRIKKSAGPGMTVFISKKKHFMHYVTQSSVNNTPFFILILLFLIT